MAEVRIATFNLENFDETAAGEWPSLRPDVDEHVDDGPVEPEFAEPPEVPPVSDDVARTARALAERVWASGAQPRSYFAARGIVESRVDEWIVHAVNMKWVVVDGDVISPGEVNPVPMTETMADPNGGGWTSRLFRR